VSVVPEADGAPAEGCRKLVILRFARAFILRPRSG
jgi:hypothetical protein